MSDGVKPVLTLEEWAMPEEPFYQEIFDSTASWDVMEDGEGAEFHLLQFLEGSLWPDERLKLAARWLHEAGLFTWADVDRLRHAADVMLNADAFGEADTDAATAYHSLADRIAALLPPRKL